MPSLCCAYGPQTRCNYLLINGNFAGIYLEALNCRMVDEFSRGFGWGKFPNIGAFTPLTQVW
jgi:hypothetical protein